MPFGINGRWDSAHSICQFCLFIRTKLFQLFLVFSNLVIGRSNYAFRRMVNDSDFFWSIFISPRVRCDVATIRAIDILTLLSAWLTSPVLSVNRRRVHTHTHRDISTHTTKHSSAFDPAHLMWDHDGLHQFVFRLLTWFDCICLCVSESMVYPVAGSGFLRIAPHLTQP